MSKRYHRPPVFLRSTGDGRIAMSRSATGRQSAGGSFTVHDPSAAGRSRSVTDASSLGAFHDRFSVTLLFTKTLDVAVTGIPKLRARSSHCVILVNRYSFSNAVTAAALIQDYDFGVIMGEQTVDMATTYGAMERFTLPETGIVVAYPKALIVRPSGIDEAHPVNPDVELPSPRIRGATDLMLEAALSYIESENRD